MPHCKPGASYATTACLCSCHFRSPDHSDKTCAAVAHAPVVQPAQRNRR